MARDRFPLLFVVVPLAATVLVGAYVWRIGRRVARLEESSTALGSETSGASLLEQIAKRLAELEVTLAGVEARLAQIESVPVPATAEAKSEATPDDPAVEASPRGWKAEASELWKAIARLEDRALQDADLFLAGDEVALLPLLEAGLDLVAERSTASGKGWSAERLVGEPDTPECGDSQSAWASLEQNETEEWIEVDFARAVLPHAVIVRATYNPGAIVRIEADANGRWVALWEGDDPTTGCPGNLVVGVGSRAFVLSTLRVVLDCSKVPGWNEIDAIGVLSGDGIQWAASARVSSSYANQ